MRDMSELPIDESGNGERLRTLTFDFADAAMLYHAAMIGGNTVLMCGGGKAENRMRYYQNKFREACPPGFEHFKREEDIAVIAIAMMDAERCTFQKIKRWPDDKEAKVEIAIGDRKWGNWGLTLEQCDEMLSCLKAICPMSCEIEVLEDQIKRGW
jgi:hypothetical protein